MTFIAEAIMPCLAVVLLLLMALAAQAAEETDRASMRTSDLIPVPIVAFGAAGPSHTRPYQLTLSIVPVLAVETHPFGRNGDSTSRLAIAIEAKQEVEWKTTSNAAQFGDGVRATLMPLLRFEAQGGRVEIKPRRHSLSMEWRMDFH